MLALNIPAQRDSADVITVFQQTFHSQYGDSKLWYHHNHHHLSFASDS